MKGHGHWGSSTEPAPLCPGPELAGDLGELLPLPVLPLVENEWW